jgi:hypothetical protein
VRTADKPKQAVVLDEEMPLSEEDIVETGPLSRAEITIDRETVLNLQSNSRLTIKKLFLKNTQLELAQGRMLAKVKPATQPDQSMIVKMPTAVVAIRGTEFGVETADGLSHVAVFNEGQVVVAGVWGHEHLILRPNQETQVTMSNVPRPAYALTHFKPYKKQIPQLRARADYWRKNWLALSPEKKQQLRKSLYAPGRKPSAKFRQRAVPQPPKHVIKKKKHKTTAKKHPSHAQARKVKTHS